jgi:hypothetical protein
LAWAAAYDDLLGEKNTIRSLKNYVFLNAKQLVTYCLAIIRAKQSIKRLNEQLNEVNG